MKKRKRKSNLTFRKYCEELGKRLDDVALEAIKLRSPGKGRAMLVEIDLSTGQVWVLP